MIVLRRQDSVPPKREQIGVMEEYYSGPGISGYLGYRVVKQAVQAFGVEHAKETKTAEPIVLIRGLSKRVRLDKGQSVTVVCYPMEGKEQ